MYFFMRRLDLFFILKMSSVILSVLFYFIVVWISCTFTQIQKQIIRAFRRLLLWLFCSVHCVLCSMKKVPFVMECNNSCIMYRMFAIKWKKRSTRDGHAAFMLLTNLLFCHFNSIILLQKHIYRLRDHRKLFFHSQSTSFVHTMNAIYLNE